MMPTVTPQLLSANVAATGAEAAAPVTAGAVDFTALLALPTQLTVAKLPTPGEAVALAATATTPENANAQAALTDTAFGQAAAALHQPVALSEAAFDQRAQALLAQQVATTPTAATTVENPAVSEDLNARAARGPTNAAVLLPLLTQIQAAAVRGGKPATSNSSAQTQTPPSANDTTEAPATDPQQALLAAVMASMVAPTEKSAANDAPVAQTQGDATATPIAMTSGPSVRRDSNPIALAARDAHGPTNETALAALAKSDASLQAVDAQPLPISHGSDSSPQVLVAPSAFAHAAEAARNNVDFAMRAPDAVVQIDVPVPATDPGFGQSVGDRLGVAIGEGHHHAELRLDPPDLGTVRVHIELKGDRASLSFVAPTEGARDALNSALPELRSALASQGLTLAHTNIGSESRANAQDQQSRNGSSFSGAESNAAEADVAPTRIVRRGLVDDYA